ncbi:hypothetical protein JW905_04665 [bacterium]|nr:hypothetical protein [candidate division CSSED10-310 bacterium]
MVGIEPVRQHATVGSASSTTVSQEEKEAIQYLQLEYPYKIQSILTLKHADRTAYERVLRRLLLEKRYMERLRETDELAYQNYCEQQELDRRVWKLAQIFNSTTDEKLKAKVKTQMERLLSELFELREERKQAEIKRLESQLKQLKDISDLRRLEKDSIIEQKLMDVLAGKENLDW